MPLQHLRASVANKRPAPSGMSDGQLAINTNDESPGLFFKNAGGTLVKIGPVHIGTTAPNATPASGGTSGNTAGELWLDSTDGDYALKTWDGSAWQTTVVTSGMIKDGTISNADINASAGIVYSKLALSSGIIDADISASAGIVYSKLALSSGIIDTDISASAAIALSKLATGALPTAITVSSGNIVDGTITNTDINASAAIAYSKLALSSGIVNTDISASAAIAGTKISPDFGSQNIVTSGTIQASNFNGGALEQTHNRIINGGMDIAQRGTSFAAIVGGAYSLDRWGWEQSGAMVCTVTQSTDVPNDTFQSSYKVDVTTVDSSIAAGDYAIIIQRVEGYNVRDLIGTTFTLSFWAKSPKTGTHCVEFKNSGADRTFVKEYTITAANTWEYKTLTVTGGLITSGTWNWTSGEGLEVGFALAAGTTNHTTADAWQTGNFLATANQVNVMDNTANEFFITGVQLEPGTVATPFERRMYGQELALCQRYYYQPGNPNYFFGTGTRVYGGSASLDASYGSSAFPVTMRAAPTSNFTASSEVNIDAGSATIQTAADCAKLYVNPSGNGVNMLLTLSALSFNAEL